MKEKALKFIAFVFTIVAITSAAFLNTASGNKVTVSRNGISVDSTNTVGSSSKFVDDVDLIGKLISKAQHLLF